MADYKLRTYLLTCKKLLVAVLKRNGHIESLCYCIDDDDEERADVLKKIAVANKDVEAAVAELRQIEMTAGNAFGVTGLIGTKTDINPHVFVAVIALALSRLNHDLQQKVNTIGDLADFVSEQDPVTALEVRDGVKLDGCLRPFVWIEPRTNVDTSKVGLLEESFERFLGREPDTEQKTLSNYRATHRHIQIW